MFTPNEPWPPWLEHSSLGISFAAEVVTRQFRLWPVREYTAPPCYRGERISFAKQRLSSKKIAPIWRPFPKSDFQSFTSPEVFYFFLHFFFFFFLQMARFCLLDRSFFVFCDRECGFWNLAGERKDIDAKNRTMVVNTLQLSLIQKCFWLTTRGLAEIFAVCSKAFSLRCSPKKVFGRGVFFKIVLILFNVDTDVLNTK